MAEITVVRQAPRSTGRVVNSVRACLLVVEGYWTWYRRNWKATVVGTVGLPLLYLIAMGVGFGSQVRSTAGLGGVSYLVYIAPGVLVAGAVQNAAAEATFPVLSGFKWQKNYLGVTASPITPTQLMSAQLLWIAIRILWAGTVYIAVAAAIGAVTSPLILVSLLFSLLCGMAFGAPLVAWSATRNDEGQGFNVVFRFIVVPMTLFAGAMFPISQLPAWVRPIAWLTPMWHGTELARGVEFGQLSLWPTVGHIAYLLALFAVGVVIARAKFRVRLAS